MSEPGAPDTIEFWFDLGSNYSYLSMMRIDALAAATGVRIVLKPFLLGPIFKSFGWDTSPFNLQKLKGEYTWRDMERQCRKYGIAWKRPSDFPRRALLPSRVAALACQEAWALAFCRRIMQLNFADDRDIDNVDAVTAALEASGADATGWLARAQSEEGKLVLRQHTEEAQRRGIFGAPMFFAGDEMYWGNDRLEDALAALKGAH